MAPYIDGLRARLVELRYTPDSIKVMLSLFGRLGRWMDDANVEVARLAEVAIASFLGVLRARGTRRVPGGRSFRLLLSYLGLADATVLRYEKLARQFLHEFAADGAGGVIMNLSAADVVAFLLRESARVSVGATKGRVAELRSLLRTPSGLPLFFSEMELFLAKGRIVHFFPEGELKPYDTSLRDFKRGAFHLAAQARVPVVPAVDPFHPTDRGAANVGWQTHYGHRPGRAHRPDDDRSSQ